jgi:hydroxymethylpyrimidine kinase/phosphomethylpyrimidine kinase
MDIMNSIVSVAGFDASSGAGIIRDVDTFFSFGFHGIAVPTSTVIQGPQGVVRVKASSAALFRDTLKAATRGVSVRGIKIGVLCSEACVKETARFVQSRKGVPVVFDPVFAAKNGTSLITEKGISACHSLLFGKTTVLTPNADEASVITGKKVRTVDEAKAAAVKIKSLGPCAVIVKGGHLAGDPVDVFFDGEDLLLHEKERLDVAVHGTGCSFSSILTCFLAAGHSLRDAFTATEGAFEELLGRRYRIDENGYYYVSTACRPGTRRACGE